MKNDLNFIQSIISFHKSKNFWHFLLLVSILFFPYGASSNSDFTSIKANTLQTFFNKLNLNYDQSLHQCYKKYYIADWHKALAIAYLENNLKDGISSLYYWYGDSNRTVAKNSAIKGCKLNKDKVHKCSILLLNGSVVNKDYLELLSLEKLDTVIKSHPNFKCKFGHTKVIKYM